MAAAAGVEEVEADAEADAEAGAAAVSGFARVASSAAPRRLDLECIARVLRVLVAAAVCRVAIFHMVSAV